MDDCEIVRLFFERSETALREVSRKYGAYCLTIARNILRNHEDAEECVNDTYMRAWDSIPPNKPPFLGAYLGRITKNLALNKARSMRSGKRGGSDETVSFEELDELVSGSYSVESESERLEILDAINAFLDSLPAKNRQMFVARYWQYYKLSELAKRFGTSESSVAVNLGRTRKKLKEYLIKRGFEV